MFQFTIRELALLTALMAFGLGWWLDHRWTKPAKDLQWNLDSLVQLIQERGYIVTIKPGFVHLQAPHDRIRGTWRERR